MILDGTGWVQVFFNSDLIKSDIKSMFDMFPVVDTPVNSNAP